MKAKEKSNATKEKKTIKNEELEKVTGGRELSQLVNSNRQGGTNGEIDLRKDLYQDESYDNRQQSYDLLTDLK